LCGESHMQPVLRLESRNGTAKRVKAKRPVVRTMTTAQRIALGVGGVGVGVLGLSVVHCTEAISLLTGSHWALSGLLAIGIDAGMLFSELAELVSHGSKAEAKVRPWALTYVAVAVLLSVLLNSFAFGRHAPESMVWAAWVLGGCIPALVFALARVA